MFCPVVIAIPKSNKLMIDVVNEIHGCKTHLVIGVILRKRCFFNAAIQEEFNTILILRLNNVCSFIKTITDLFLLAVNECTE